VSALINIPLATLSLTVRMWGNGPRCAMLLHGFPDTPDGMAPVAERLVAAGYTVAAPYLRGYAPSDLAPDGRYDVEVLSADILCLLEELDFSDTCLVGHDWGAVIAYACAAQDVERISRVVALSVPPIPQFIQGFRRNPSQLWYSGYMGLFQLTYFAESRVSKNEYEYIDALWARWSPNLTPPAGHLDAVKACLAHPGSLRAALSYYRALIPGRSSRWLENWRLAHASPLCPIVVMCGAADGCIQAGMFSEIPYPTTTIPDVGHFMALEAPDFIAEVCLQG
jgi:pimeloyl-ACP methyl ester carboxylesterase